MSTLPATSPASQLAAARVQSLVIHLAGITAGDLLTWVRDPEPPGLGRELQVINVAAKPPWDRIELTLVWDRDPPERASAAPIAGFPTSPQVTAVSAALPPQPATAPAMSPMPVAPVDAIVGTPTPEEMPCTTHTFTQR